MALIKNDGNMGVNIYIYHTHEAYDNYVDPVPCWDDLGNAGGVIKTHATRYSEADRIANSPKKPVYASVVSPNSGDLIDYCEIGPHDLVVFDGSKIAVDNGYTGSTDPRQGW